MEKEGWRIATPFSNPAPATAYGLLATTAGQRHAKKAVVMQVPITPRIETGAKAASDDKLQSGAMSVDVMARIEAWRVTAQPGKKEVASGDPRRTLLNMSPKIKLKVRQLPKQKTKVARETNGRLELFSLDASVAEPVLVVACTCFQISPSA